jgi:peptidoglycan/LPS O-acetylase OafA/YrhL
MGEIAPFLEERMRRIAISTVLTLAILAATGGPTFAKHSPFAEEETQIASALWLSSLESWQQAFEREEVAEESSKLQGTEFDVQTTPTEIYIIRWYKDE